VKKRKRRRRRPEGSEMGVLTVGDGHVIGGAEISSARDGYFMKIYRTRKPPSFNSSTTVGQLLPEFLTELQ
jgi:hypothetical protein